MPDLTRQMARRLEQRRLRLQTLIRIRWIAVIGQSVAVLFVAGLLDFVFPALLCFLLIGLAAWLNVFLRFRFPPTLRLSSLAAFSIFTFDILQLGGLLFLTGGLENPFALLIIVPATIASASLPIRYTILLGLIVITAVTVLAFFHLPLPWQPENGYQLPQILVAGIWVAIVSSLTFGAVYVFRVANEARQLGDALTSTELILQREQHLSALDGLAAAAAHELGTPLSTIALVVKEMQRSLGSDPRYAEDIALLRSQSDRCRDILKRLSSLSSAGDDHLARLPLSSLLEETIAPHRRSDVEITVDIAGSSSEPVGRRNAGILYGLSNIVENAVDFAAGHVHVEASFNDEEVRIAVSDDGKGFSGEALANIGEPFVRIRGRRGGRSQGGLGLGLFIAKTLLERSGATLTFANRPTPSTGAIVTVRWPRAMMEKIVASSSADTALQGFERQSVAFSRR